MLHHYLKIAVRNLVKYKTQSVISIVGLAIGFTCFSLSSLWIRYEMTYDSFHDGAERIFLVRHESAMNDNGVSPITPYVLAGYLKETFPEVEEACNTNAWETKVQYENVEYPIFRANADSAFMRFFGIQVIEGNVDFLKEGSQEIAVTRAFAKRLFGEESPFGKQVKIYGRERSVCALVTDWSEHSNMPFGLLQANYTYQGWNASSHQTFIRIKEGTDINTFRDKLYQHKVEKDGIIFSKIVLTPITAMHYDRPDRPQDIRFSHIQLFALVSGLIILCSLINFLTLFINRIHIRKKEIGLRVVCGSSNRRLLGLFSVEYVLILLLAILLGFVLMELATPYFKTLANIKMDTYGIYAEAIFYSVTVAALSLLLSLIPIYFRSRALNVSIKGPGKIRGYNLFQRASIVFQCVISILFIFCTVVLIKQIHFLTHTDRVVAREGRAVMSMYPAQAAVKEEMKQIPFITEIESGEFLPLLPTFGQAFQQTTEWDDKPASAENVMLEMMKGGASLCRYYELTLLEGRMLEEGDADKKVLINEAAARQFGWKDPVGKTYMRHDSTRVEVVGLLRDFISKSPLVPIMPLVIVDRLSGFNMGWDEFVLFKFHPGRWEECKQAIETLLREKYPETVRFDI
ncbi:MAG: ABC transporter permease, partial [Tannerellaceae bacterium]|nr:ABC transporter permease [Tannerellaceae bacterium]